MKKLTLVFMIICAAFATLYIINPPEVTFSSTEIAAPSKPKSVPDAAFWVGGADGGNFIYISKKIDSKKIYAAQIYNDYTAETEYSGALQYLGVAEDVKSLKDVSIYQGWDGEKLHLANGEYMSIYKD